MGLNFLHSNLLDLDIDGRSPTLVVLICCVDQFAAWVNLLSIHYLCCIHFTGFNLLNGDLFALTGGSLSPTNLHYNVE